MDFVNNKMSVITIDMRFQNGLVDDQNEYRYMDYPSVCYNIDDIETCYSKRLDQDALKILDIVKDKSCFEEITNLKLIVAGPSQGGGLSLMVSAMSDYPINCCLSDIPSDCAIKDRINGEYGKYGVIKEFLAEHKNLKETVMKNQDYFDVINMASKIKCPVISSIGKLDKVCPPEFFYQAYKKITTKKEIFIYDDYGHGGFDSEHFPKKIAFLNTI